MYWGVENGDVGGGHCFVNSHTLSEANKLSSFNSTNKRDSEFSNVSETEDTGLQDDVDINDFSASKPHQYSNI